MSETKATSGKPKTVRVTLRDQLLAQLRGGAEGVKNWNGRKYADRLKAGPYRQADLSGAELRGVDLASPSDLEDKCLNFQEAIFDNAILMEANLDHSIFTQASFSKADCRQARLRGARCQFACFEQTQLQQAKLRGTLFNNAKFAGADLTGADLCFANLCDADLSDAILTDVKFDHTKFNNGTRFPAGFVKGVGLELLEAVAIKPSTPAPSKAAPAAAEAVPPPSFLKQLEKKVNPGRFERAREMLRAERFHLFSQVEEGALVGVVRSQREPDLVYACSLDRDGSFSCCSHLLEECMGLQGALCKHLLVLIIGLTQTGNLDPAVVLNWVEESLRKKNHPDTDRASATLLRYKGAEAGEIDWRPTETVPEDFYAF